MRTAGSTDLSLARRRPSSAPPGRLAIGRPPRQWRTASIAPRATEDRGHHPQTWRDRSGRRHPRCDRRRPCARPAIRRRRLPWSISPATRTLIRTRGPAFAADVGVDFVLPYVIYSWAAPHYGDVEALIASSLPPILWSIVEFVRHRRIDAGVGARARRDRPVAPGLVRRRGSADAPAAREARRRGRRPRLTCSRR